jgi:hypothetical protein
MGFNEAFAYGTRRLIDSQLQLTRAGFPVYLRLKNFPDVQANMAAQLGFAITPTGAATGTTDILITPAPAVTVVSVHNIGQSAGKLRFGAKYFLISDSFVQKQAVAMGLSDSTALWRSPSVVGLITNSLVFSIEDITNEQLAGETITWLLTCNSLESQ